MNHLETTHTFWEAAGQFYAVPGAEAALLSLQDDHGADVIALLYALWRGGRNEALTPPDAARVFALSAAWGAKVTGPTRAVRRRLSRKYADGRRALDAFGPDLEAAAATARAALAAAELAAERALITALEATPVTPCPAPPAAAIARNLAAYSAYAPHVTPRALAPVKALAEKFYA